ncbi:MAG: hypothetical protein OK457_07430 [Thaumarchaeota archaeon]|nr:hypothetical protein [Nitrososphaerota archaeon]
MSCVVVSELASDVLETVVQLGERDPHELPEIPEVVVIIEMFEIAEVVEMLGVVLVVVARPRERYTPTNDATAITAITTINARERVMALVKMFLQVFERQLTFHTTGFSRIFDPKFYWRVHFSG